VLIGLALLLGCLANAVLSGRIPWHGEWGSRIEAQASEIGLEIASLEDVRAAGATGDHLLLDARPAVEYRAGRIPGALSFPVSEMESGFRFMDVLMPEDRLIIFCSGYGCDDSLVLARYMQDAGYTNIAVFPGGWNEWTASRSEGERER
jgi:rhodanese-related sulfurtransferase